MDLLFCSDVHGDESHYARLITVAGRLRPHVIILGGDMLPDDSALDPRSMGVGQPTYVRNQFRNHVAAMRAASGCKNVLVIFGNHDWGSSVRATRELETEGLLNVLELDHSFEVDGLHFLGYSSTPPTPWYVKDFERLDMPGDKPPLLGGARWDFRFSRPSQQSSTYLFNTVKTMADELADLKPPPEPWVFVAHSPPHQSKLDRYYGDQAWGSRAVRGAIEKHQPLLSLHGHIHESPDVSGDFKDVIGRTTAVNPGQNRHRLQYATVRIDVAGRKVLEVKHGWEA
ncbi:MAG: hypothetical protein DCC65_03030 [Planctomycetota bacterium]|nr:MAG: hypothetical protein DCC65_03030 [Planctomycetota bacterium]